MKPPSVRAPAAAGTFYLRFRHKHVLFGREHEAGELGEAVIDELAPGIETLERVHPATRAAEKS